MEDKNLNDMAPVVDYSKELEQLSLAAKKYNSPLNEYESAVKAEKTLKQERQALIDKCKKAPKEEQASLSEQLKALEQEQAAKLAEISEDKAEAATLLKASKAELSAAIKAVKLAQKQNLKSLQAEHKKQLQEFKLKQDEELKNYISSFPSKKDVAEACARLKIEQETALTELKASHEAKLAALDSSNQDALLSLKKKNQTEILEVTYAQKAEMTKTKNSVLSAFLLNKFKYQQYLDYSKYEQELQYDEYNLELAQAEEIDRTMGKKKDESGDQDVEHGNPVLVWFKQFFRDIRVSVKEKPSIIFGLLLCLPGILIGFNIDKFINSGYGFPENASYVGIIVFGYELLGMINIVNGFGMCNQRRLKSVVNATLTSAISISFSLAWIIAINRPDFVPGLYQSQADFTVFLMAFSIIINIVGVVGGYFTYDKHYQKEVKR